VIGVGGIADLALDEALARNLIHRAQHRLIGDPAPPQREQKLHPLVVLNFNLAGQRSPRMLPDCRDLPDSVENASPQGTEMPAKTFRRSGGNPILKSAVLEPVLTEALAHAALPG
jgi:hypothetical protein